MPTLSLFSKKESCANISRISAHAMNAPLSATAELWVSVAQDSAILLGAFQRAWEVDANAQLLRRASGGPAISIAPGVVHIALALSHPAALTPCDAPRLVNRYVRPLMRALSSFGEKTPYFGRDWLSAQHRPVAWVGFAHDSSSKRAVLEAVIGVNARWSLDQNRASFLGKSEITLAEANARAIETDAVAEAVLAEYEEAFGGQRADAPAIETSAPAIESEPKWSAQIEEAIGVVAAGRDRNSRMRVGGQLLASRDAISALEERIAAFDARTSLAEIGAAVDATLTKPGIALHGIKSLVSVRDVIARALLEP